MKPPKSTGIYTGRHGDGSEPVSQRTPIDPWDTVGQSDHSRLPRWMLELRASCAGRNPWIRLPLLLWAGWTVFMHLSTPGWTGLTKGLDLGVHELGHILWDPLGDTMGILGGSLTQCLLPLVGAVMFWRQRDGFALGFAACWLCFNLCDVAIYVADARALELPLVSPFAGDVILHDWNTLLCQWGLLHHDLLIAQVLRVGAAAFGLAGLGFMSLHLMWMATLPPPQNRLI